MNIQNKNDAFVSYDMCNWADIMPHYMFVQNYFSRWNNAISV
jgi:hypothetical protein